MFNLIEKVHQLNGIVCQENESDYSSFSLQEKVSRRLDGHKKKHAENNEVAIIFKIDSSCGQE